MRHDGALDPVNAGPGIQVGSAARPSRMGPTERSPRNKVRLPLGVGINELVG
jgi:hypothetical protein